MRVIAYICAFGLLMSPGGAYAQDPMQAFLDGLPRLADIKTKRAITKKEMEDLRDRLSKSLKDSDSAKYKDVFIAIEADGTQHACGSINAKNSYGGYTGFSRFVAINLLMPQFETGSIDEKRLFDASTWKSYCTLKL